MRLFLLSFLLIANVALRFPGTEPMGKKVSGIINKAASRLYEKNETNNYPFLSKAQNDSLARMSLAVRKLLAQENQAVVSSLAQEARMIDPKNHFSFVLEAVVAESQGNRKEANEFLEQFLLESRKFGKFEETFLKWGEFHQLRHSIYVLLKSRGVSFKGKEKQLHLWVSYVTFFRYLLQPDRKDRLIHLFFMVTSLAGGVLLLMAFLRGRDFSQPYFGMLLMMYMAFLTAFGLWMFDIAFGLPFGWNRFVAVPIFLLLSVIAPAATEVVLYIKDKHAPLEPGYVRCPHCQAVIVALSVECSVCRKKI